jgi:hypothetical protein
MAWILLPFALLVLGGAGTAIVLLRRAPGCRMEPDD